MSAYPFYSFHFVLRPDQLAAYDVLAAVAQGRRPADAVLARVHPVPRYFLADAERFLHDEAEPRVGTPVRLAGEPGGDGPVRLSIELCLHDDEFANAGWVFWLWLLSLVEPPSSPNRAVIGYQGTYRNDDDTELVVATAEGVLAAPGVAPIPYDEIRAVLADWGHWETWLTDRLAWHARSCQAPPR